jgi:ankyrin repeat protein
VPGQANKRKRDELDSFQWHSTPLTLRYELVQNMLRCGIDVNNYDKQGNTVLMAFVTHLCDCEDDKTLAKLLHLLIPNGADIHRRNRQGETALHVAVRLGRKTATKVLLENSANVHARTVEGKGVLAVGEEHCLEEAEDRHLYSSILACMGLAIRYGAVAAPTLVQEWSLSNL